MPKVDDYSYPPGLNRENRLLVDQMLWALHLHGPFEDEDSGRAIAMMRAKMIELGAVVPEAPSVVSRMARELTAPRFGAYVLKTSSATRTTYIGLKKGCGPGRVPFPENPFADAVAEPEEEVLTEPETVELDPLAEAEDVLATSADASRDGLPAHRRAALDLVSAAVTLVGTLNAMPSEAPVAGDRMNWVKQLVDDNVELRDENRRLEEENQTLVALVRELRTGLNAVA